MTCQTFDEFEAWFLDEGDAQSLQQLAGIVLRRIRDEADAILTRAIDMLQGEANRSARVHAEAFSLRAILNAATPPEAMRAAPSAPARGAMRLVTEFHTPPGGMSVPVSQHWQGLDQLSAMNRHAYSRHRAKDARDAEGNPLPFAPLFTPGQIAMAQRYLALIERHEAAGMKCVSVEVRNAASSGTGGSFIDAYLDESKEIALIRHRIGDGLALEVKRGAGKRRNITARRLVDMVCLEGADLTAVLRAHGWVKDVPVLQRLRLALAQAMDRAQGY